MTRATPSPPVDARGGVGAERLGWGEKQLKKKLVGGNTYPHLIVFSHPECKEWREVIEQFNGAVWKMTISPCRPRGFNVFSYLQR